MLMTKKRDKPLPSHRLALRYLEDHSSSDNFSLDDSLDSSSVHHALHQVILYQILLLTHQQLLLQDHLARVQVIQDSAAVEELRK
ncbi:hypothetical protein Tco_0376798 [Tanacetum coccineum]